MVHIHSGARSSLFFPHPPGHHRTASLPISISPEISSELRNAAPALARLPPPAPSPVWRQQALPTAASSILHAGVQRTTEQARPISSQRRASFSTPDLASAAQSEPCSTPASSTDCLLCPARFQCRPPTSMAYAEAIAELQLDADDWMKGSASMSTSMRLNSRRWPLPQRLSQRAAAPHAGARHAGEVCPCRLPLPDAPTGRGELAAFCSCSCSWPVPHAVAAPPRPPCGRAPLPRGAVAGVRCVRCIWRPNWTNGKIAFGSQ